MDFDLDPESAAYRDEFRAFASEQVTPAAATHASAGTYPDDLLAALADRGAFGITVAESHGGLGASTLAYAVAVEELAAAWMAPASVLSGHLRVASLLERAARESVAETWLPRLAAGDAVGAMGVTEAAAGNDLTRVETAAERDGDGWVLTGRKRWVTNFPAADVAVVLARTDGAPGDTSGLSLFLVSTDQLTRERTWETFGLRSVPTCAVSLSDVRVPVDRLVGDRGAGLDLLRATPSGTVNVAARGVGIARAALADAADHVARREQFGHPVGEFQGVRWTLAEMSRRVETARLLTRRAAARVDDGSGDGLAMAKLHASEAAVDNAADAMQLHGGVGYTDECDVGRYLRDARILTIAGGSNEVHRDRVADAVTRG